jgi:hypothetical protein
MYNNNGSNPIITNCSFLYNSAGASGGGICNNMSNPTIGNSIIWGNNAPSLPNIQDYNSTSVINFSNVAGGYPGTGNINADPMLVNASDSNGPDGISGTADDGIRLLPCSPSVNAGNNADIPGGVITDIAGNARIQLGNIDMGAYETITNPVMVIADSNQTITKCQTNTTFYSSGCNSLITTILASGTNPVSNNVTSKVWLESTPPPDFVSRHYEITPANNASTSTGTITLYFTQPEFDAFNAVNTIKLPVNPADASGIANLKIEKRSGVSSDGSGLPGTYSGGITMITPSGVIWNTTATRWEVTFSVTGFSGFFIKATGFTLPVTLVSFAATKQPNDDVLLQWKTTDEQNVNHFEIEKSNNGTGFERNGVNVPAHNGITNEYQMVDNSTWTSDVRYYRLKAVDNDGKFRYSNIVRLYNRQTGGISVYPNPGKDVFTIQVTGNKLLHTTALLADVNGNTVKHFNINSQSFIANATGVAAGVYMLKFADGSCIKIIKQ